MEGGALLDTPSDTLRPCQDSDHPRLRPEGLLRKCAARPLLIGALARPPSFRPAAPVASCRGWVPRPTLEPKAMPTRVEPGCILSPAQGPPRGRPGRDCERNAPPGSGDAAPDGPP